MIQQNLFTYFRKTAADKRKSGNKRGSGRKTRSGKFFLLLEQLTNSNPYPVVCFDGSGKIIYCNNASENLNHQLSRGKVITDIFNIPDNISDLILNDSQIDFPIDICDNRYSALLKGSSELNVAFIYFLDCRQVRTSNEELQQSNLKLKKYSGRLTDVLEQEKQKLACELHDSLAQNLISIRIKLQKHRELFNFYNSTDEYQDMLNLLEHSFKHIKFISYGLMPRILDEMGLEPALISFCNSISDETGIKSSINIVNGPEPLDHKLQTHLYRFIQETLHNRLCTSDLSEFNVQVIDFPKSVKIFFTDNGTANSTIKDFKLKEFGAYSIPLDFIKEKAENMDGKMKIDFSEDNGTIIIIEIPKNRIN